MAAIDLEILKSVTALITSAAHIQLEGREERDFIDDLRREWPALGSERRLTLAIGQLSFLCSQTLIELARANDDDPVQLLQRIALRHTQLADEEDDQT